MTVNDANGTLDLGSLNQIVGALNGSGTVTSLSNPAGVTAPSTAILTVLNDGTFSGAISDGSGAALDITTGLTVGGGTLLLTGDSTALTYTGVTTINSGATLTAAVSRRTLHADWRRRQQWHT